MNNAKLAIGEKVRIKSTGQEVTVDRISEHGFSIIRFNTGGKHRFLNEKLEKIDSRQYSLNS